MYKFRYFIFLFFIPFVSFSQLKSYQYYREIKPVASTDYYELKIGSSVLDRPGFYRVYEISKNDTIELPYISSSKYYDTYDKKYFKNLQIIDKSYEKNKASYATLVVDTGFIYNSVYLQLNGSDFFKNISIEGSDDNKKWKTIIENEKIFNYYKNSDEHYFRNKVVFNPVSYKYLRLIFDDSQSEKTELLAASVPFLKEEPVSDGESVRFEMKRADESDKKRTVLECKFSRKYFITSLQLNIENDPAFFKREAEVFFYANNNSKNEEANWVKFDNSTISSNSANKLFLTRYDYEDDAFKSDKMRVVIHNRDDRPLKIIRINAFTHEQSIKLKLEKDKRYVLAYGKLKDTRPEYDIEYFTNTLPLNVAKVDLAGENKIPQIKLETQKPLIDNTKWIWIALVVCVVLIGFFAIKLLKNPEEK